MNRGPSRLRMAAEAVFVGVPCLILFRLWVMALAEELKPDIR
jgi:hypothetical protein